MNKALVIRAIKFSLIFMTAFLILNLLTMKEASISSIIVRTVIAAIVFFVIYIIVFTILSSSERKIIYGTTLPIALLYALYSSNFHSSIGIIAGLIIGVFAGVIWEFLNRKMEVAHLDYYYRTHCNYFVNH